MATSTKNSNIGTTTTPDSNNTETLKYIISIVSVIVLIGLVILLWILYRKFYQRIRNPHNKPNRTNINFNNSLTTSNNHVNSNSVDCQQPKCIDPSHLTRLRQLGKGNTSVVQLMSYRQPGKAEIQIAIKNIISMQSNSEDSLREINLISECKHPNIVKFIGYYKEENFETFHIATEFMPGGDLHSYLRDESNRPTIRAFFSYILQIAEGMEYLSHKHLVHRDLAARNCLLDITKTIVKITDFGLSRKCNIEYEYISSRASNGDPVSLPIRWIAIEVLRDPTIFSEKSDVWSYGVVLWELFTRGQQPYLGMNQEEIKTYLLEGKRLEQPMYMPDELYKVTCRCWEELPDTRPRFNQLKVDINQVLDELQNHDSDYLDCEYERPISP